MLSSIYRNVTGLRSFAVALALTAGVSAANAHPIADPGYEGFDVVVGSTDPIIATYLGTTASFSNDLYLLNTGAFIFNNHLSPVGSTVDLGSFAIGTVLTFRLHVNNTGDDFFTGAASLNPDNQAHARVQSNYLEVGTTLVSFEDLLGGPYEYNDLSFSFSNTISSVDVGETPIPGAVLLFGSVLAGGVGLLRRRTKLSSTRA